LDEGSQVEIVLYDEQGSVKQQLLNSNLDKGIYEEKIRCDDLPAGNYFASIWIEGKNILLKFTVEK